MTKLLEKTHLAPPVQKEEISLEVKSRPDVGKGMYEVSVKVHDRPSGSSFVLTSPRNFATRKTA